MEYDAASDKYIARFYVNEKSGSVLGGNAIMGHDVLFDIDNDRIGWAESSCDYTSLITSNGYPSVIEGDGTIPSSTPRGKGAGSEPQFYKFEDGFQAFLQTCDSVACRGSLIAGFFVMMILGCCLYRCFCTSRRSSGYEMTPKTGVHHDGIEMSSYKDEPVPDDEDAEFDGDFR
jgi:hypothetical protein